MASSIETGNGESSHYKDDMEHVGALEDSLVDADSTARAVAHFPDRIFHDWSAEELKLFDHLAQFSLSQM